MKIALIGAKGQLGRDLATQLPQTLIPCSREQFDLTNFSQSRNYLTAIKPDIIINCSAYNFVDQAENEPENAFLVNTWSVKNLAQIARDLEAKFVHYSTDYVFGLYPASTPLHETDRPGPLSNYGLSKLNGEYLIQQICTDYLIIRTCGLYGLWGSGGKGGNFVETMLRVASQGKPLRVVNDQICTPTFTEDLAKTSIQLILAGGTGLFHITNQNETSWHDFAKEIFHLAGLTPSLTAITSNEFGAIAKRPPYSVLSMSRLDSFGIPKPPSWQDAVARYLHARKKRI